MSVLTQAGLIKDYWFSGSVRECVFIVQDVLVKHNVTVCTVEHGMHDKCTAPTGLHMQFRKPFALTIS